MSRISNVATVLFGALVALALTGCIKTKTVIDLKADGSGTATITLVADLSKMDGLKEMMEGMGMGGGQGGGMGEMDDMLDFEEITSAIKEMEGVRLVSQKSLDDDANKKKGAEIVVAFDSLQAFAKSGMVSNLGTELKKNDDGTLTLVMSTLPEQLEGMDMEDPAAAQQMEMAKGFLPMLEPFLGGFEMAEIIKLPGEITATNGAKGETGNSVQWKMGFADIMDVKKLTRSVTFKAEGTTLAAFKIDAKVGREAMEKARAKIEGLNGGTSGATPLAGSEAERNAKIEATKARIAALELAAESTAQAAEAARVAMEQAKAALERARAKLKELAEVEPAGK